MNFWIPLIVTLISILLFVLFSRRDEKRVEKEWRFLLQPESAQVINLVQHSVGMQMQVLDFNLDMARQLKSLRNVDDAIHLLTLGYQTINKFVPNLMMLLTIMMRFSRMVAAITPLDPLHPARYRTGQMASLAYLHRWLNHLARSVREGFRLRLFILSKGISMTSAHLFRSIQRVIMNRSMEEREWEQIDACHHDMGCLTQESLESFCWMIAALSADSHRNMVRDLRKRLGTSQD